MGKIDRKLNISVRMVLDEGDPFIGYMPTVLSDVGEHHRRLSEDGRLSNYGQWEHPETGALVSWTAESKVVPNG